MSKVSNNAGRFVWHELVTASPKDVLPFYGELFGWTTAEMDMGPNGKYTLFRAGSVDVAGTIAPPPGAKVPPSWLGYCAVDDLDAALKVATTNGGKLMSPTVDIPKVGRFAVVIDPQGALLAAMQPHDARSGEEGPRPAGHFAWDELLAQDPEGALSFYRAVYGYESRANDLGAMGTYHVLSSGGRERAGIMKAPMAGQPSSWLFYVNVPDVDAGTKRAAALRGSVVVAPKDIPNIGRFSVVTDPAGATIALFKASADMKM